MKELRGQTWNWLPAFLEVAESGGITEASRRLYLTPAAVSRTIRLLEEEIGEPLFNRVGRTLTLNPRGNSLRNALRVAVRSVDRGLAASLQDPFSGGLRVASLGVLTEHIAIPCLLELKASHTKLVPEHINLRAGQATDLLVRGEIDVALYYEELTVEGLVIEQLGTTSMSVYCGRAHSLFKKQRVRAKDVLNYPFSVPQMGDSGQVMDGWPSDIPREIGMRISVLRSNLQVSLSGQLLTVLPDIEAAESISKGELKRLPFRDLPPIQVIAARSAAGEEQGPTQLFIESVRARLKKINQSIPKRKR